MRKDNHKELICRTFKQASRDIWRDYGESAERGFIFGEETITETTLMELARRMPRTLVSRNFHIATEPFNKTEERKNGADWEWFIIDGNEWTKLLVQAKKLKIKDQKNKYNLHHLYTDGSNQCQNIIYRAWEKEYIPVYCFYNYLEQETYSTVIPTSDDGCFPTDYELLGWTYCYADYLYPTSNSEKKFEEVFDKSFTVSRLFCGDLSVDNIIGEYNDLGDGGGGDGLKIPSPPSPDGKDLGGKELPKPKIEPKTVNELPEYVKQMLHDSQITIKDIGEINFSDAIPELSPLVVVTIRVPSDSDSDVHKSNEPVNEATIPPNTKNEEIDSVEVLYEENNEKKKNIGTMKRTRKGRPITVK
ncbi:hypothetical protein SAMN05518871_102125 [Psychrobacillus sp. OK028]|uniref:DUF6615 family protein n=1 Tax=Psychrobacillus sp. OK028 TaxID=1884359 RepID=UPI00088DDDE0|nr:DUF6615 family protein [Psychrobacillus sp. OK028]SDM73900.1 hypothetical protein SAMN05518871_102125 [Psychrobacillus sp. OK028]